MAHYEAEHLEKLRREFRFSWIFIKMQAEAEIKVTMQLHDKIDEQILDSQERAFWDLHRPMVINNSLKHNIRVFRIYKFV